LKTVVSFLLNATRFIADVNLQNLKTCISKDGVYTRVSDFLKNFFMILCKHMGIKEDEEKHENKDMRIL